MIKFLIAVLTIVFVILFEMRKKKINNSMTSNDKNTESNSYDKNLDYRLRTDWPNAMRNNNPLALIKSNISWKGKTTGTSNLETFLDSRWGVRAGIMNLRNHYFNKGKKTFGSIINEYTGETGKTDLSKKKINNYLKVIQDNTGITAITDLTGKLHLLAYGIHIAENGRPFWTKDEFLRLADISEKL